MKKSAGFTLIELVIVIIILGILGAVAAPRLFNLQGDAYGANLNAMKSSISTAMTMANAKAQIEGKMDKSVNNIKGYTSDDLDEAIVFNFGYPTIGTDGNGWKDGVLGTLDNFEYSRYEITKGEAVTEIDYEDADTLLITPTSINKIAYKTDNGSDACVVVYTEATAKKGTNDKFTNPKPAKVEVFTDGC